MNKERRLRISDLSSKADALVNEIETIRDEEQEYYDNMPESLQGGEKGTAAEEAISALENAISYLQDVIAALDEAAGG